MSVRRLVFAFGLASLLAAAAAVADTVVTAAEVIYCSVVSADSNFVRLKLPPGGIRLLYTRDVYEVRLADSAAFAVLAVRLPDVVRFDSGQAVPPPAERLRVVAGRGATYSASFPATVAVGAGVPKPVRPSAGDYLLESGGALGGGCCLGFLPLAIGFGLLYDAGWSGKSTTPGLIVGGIGLAAYATGSAAAANMIGNKLGWSGSFGWSLGMAAGAVAGGLALVGLASSTDPEHPAAGIAASYAGMALCVLGPPLLAASGYNHNPKRREPRAWESRIAPPSFAARVESTREPGAAREIGCDVRLVTVRF